MKFLGLLIQEDMNIVILEFCIEQIHNQECLKKYVLRIKYPISL